MISEGHWSNNAVNAALIAAINNIWTHIRTENDYLNYFTIILYFWSNKCEHKTPSLKTRTQSQTVEHYTVHMCELHMLVAWCNVWPCHVHLRTCLFWMVHLGLYCMHWVQEDTVLENTCLDNVFVGRCPTGSETNGSDIRRTSESSRKKPTCTRPKLLWLRRVWWHTAARPTPRPLQTQQVRP